MGVNMEVNRGVNMEVNTGVNMDQHGRVASFRTPIFDLSHSYL